MRALFLLTILIIAIKSFSAPNEFDTSGCDKTGWLVFRGDEIVWVPSSLQLNVRTEDFFLTKQYTEGIIVEAFIEAAAYKSLATFYKVYFKDTKRNGEIGILPVKVKWHKRESEENSDTFGWLFRKGNNYESSIIYKYYPDYFLSDILLLRKTDNVKYNKQKGKHKNK